MAEPAASVSKEKDLSEENRIRLEEIIKVTLEIEEIADYGKTLKCPPAPGYRAVRCNDGSFLGYFIGYKQDFTAEFGSEIARITITPKKIEFVEIKEKLFSPGGFKEKRDRHVFNELAAQLAEYAHKYINAQFIRFMNS